MSRVETLLDNYKYSRTEYLDGLKKMGIFGVYRGALKYLECLTYQPVQELKEDSLEHGSDEETSSLNKETSLQILMDYVRHVFGKFSHSIEEFAAKV